MTSLFSDGCAALSAEQRSEGRARAAAGRPGPSRKHCWRQPRTGQDPRTAPFCRCGGKRRRRVHDAPIARVRSRRARARTRGARSDVGLPRRGGLLSATVLPHAPPPRRAALARARRRRAPLARARRGRAALRRRSALGRRRRENVRDERPRVRPVVRRRRAPEYVLSLRCHMLEADGTSLPDAAKISGNDARLSPRDDGRRPQARRSSARATGPAATAIPPRAAATAKFEIARARASRTEIAYRFPSPRDDTSRPARMEFAVCWRRTPPAVRRRKNHRRRGSILVRREVSTRVPSAELGTSDSPFELRASFRRCGRERKPSMTSEASRRRERRAARRRASIGAATAAATPAWSKRTAARFRISRAPRSSAAAERIAAVLRGNDASRPNAADTIEDGSRLAESSVRRLVSRRELGSQTRLSPRARFAGTEAASKSLPRRDEARLG